MEQKLKLESYDRKEIAHKYFSILSIARDLHLTEREIDLLSHISTKGTIDSKSAKDEFVELYHTSLATLNNIISKLYHKKILKKIEGKKRINPLINIDFNQVTSDNDLKIQIRCIFKDKELIQ